MAKTKSKKRPSRARKLDESGFNLALERLGLKPWLYGYAVNPQNGTAVFIGEGNGDDWSARLEQVHQRLLGASAADVKDGLHRQFLDESYRIGCAITSLHSQLRAALERVDHAGWVLFGPLSSATRNDVAELEMALTSALAVTRVLRVWGRQQQ